MRARRDVPFAELTTLRVGGPAGRLVEAASADEVIEAVSRADVDGEPVLVIGGGSNLVVADAGFDGTVVRIGARGISTEGRNGTVGVTVAAGEPWDGLVARCVADGLAGIECLSGIPGAAGATPIQNVGAYGQEIAQTITGVRAFDRREREVVELSPADCRFAYRSSALKGSERHVVLEVRLELERGRLGKPLRYGELARRLEAAAGERMPLAEVRDAVLGLRRGKGMVIDPADPDSVSAGSFFTNPVLTAGEFAGLERRVAEDAGADVHAPGWPAAAGGVKTSAAWMIERAGFHRGYGDGPAGLSTKHTLAVVNRGGASAGDVLSLAREIRDGVRAAFGVTLVPEPTLVGVSL